MKPSAYIKDVLTSSNNTFSRVLTPGQMVDAGDVIKAGLDFIGRKLDEQYIEMTPEAVESANILQCFMVSFIEHSVNPALLKKSLRAV